MLALRALLPSYQARITLCRTFSTAGVLAAKQLPPRPKIEEADIEENFLKGNVRPISSSYRSLEPNKLVKAVVLAVRR